MIRYVIKRLLLMIPILIAVAILVFALMSFIPGDPATIILGETATPAEAAELREEMGLNRPFLVRLGEYLYDLFLRFDFGTSYLYSTKVGPELASRFPRSLILAVSCIVTCTIFGVLIGIYSALNANKLGDRISMVLTIVCNSMPGFWLALLLVLLFSVELGWLPATGYKSWQNYVLPTVANCISSLASVARQTRASMLEVIRSDFIVTARSKGIKKRTVILGHALPNALIPVITISGSHFGHMLGGMAVIENIFAIPGVGSYMVQAVNSRDYPAAQGCMIYLAFTFSIVMLLTDLFYAFVDPRIKSQYIKHRKKRGGAAAIKAGG